MIGELVLKAFDRVGTELGPLASVCRVSLFFDRERGIV